jgi:hypothetical protein
MSFEATAPPSTRPASPSVRPSVPAPAPAQASVDPESEPADRETLFELLADEQSAWDVAIELRDHAEWLVGRPPASLLTALSRLDYDVESPIFELARAWEREPICRAVIGSLRDEPDPKLREHSAWLLKHVGAPGAWTALADLVGSETEPPPVRRWLLEAIARLVAAGSLGWRDVSELVHHCLRHTDSTIRDGVIGVIAELELSNEKRRVLLELLRVEHDEMVLASAVKALTTALPIVLDPAVAERLLGHPSPRVQRSVAEFVEGSKRGAART